MTGDLSTHVASHRSTTSSRRPGVEITGTVFAIRSQAITCVKCGRLRTVTYGDTQPGPHARRIQALGVVPPVFIDCVGEVVQ